MKRGRDKLIVWHPYLLKLCSTHSFKAVWDEEDVAKESCPLNFSFLFFPYSFSSSLQPVKCGSKIKSYQNGRRKEEVKCHHLLLYSPQLFSWFVYRRLNDHHNKRRIIIIIFLIILMMPPPLNEFVWEMMHSHGVQRDKTKVLLHSFSSLYSTIISDYSLV